MSTLDSLLRSAIEDDFSAPEGEYHSVIAICFITPWQCKACGDKGRNISHTFTALRHGHSQRVGLQGGVDSVAFLSQYPTVTKQVELRELEFIPFCACAEL